MDRTHAALERALAGDAEALAALVDAVTPIVQVRAVRVLARGGRAAGRDLRQEVEDLTQDVLCALFADSARALRAWDVARGLSFANYVGLLAEREVGHIVRSGRRDPFRLQPTEDVELERGRDPEPGPEGRVASRQLFRAIWRRLQAELSPKGLELFELLLLDELSVEVVCARTSMTPDAVYAWRSRLLKRVRAIAVELGGPLDTSEPRATRPTPLRGSR